MGGDYNSQPNSSVMSLFHGENIESEGASWTIPPEVEEWKRDYYKRVNEMF